MRHDKPNAARNSVISPRTYFVGGVVIGRTLWAAPHELFALPKQPSSWAGNSATLIVANPSLQPTTHTAMFDLPDAKRSVSPPARSPPSLYRNSCFPQLPPSTAQLLTDTGSGGRTSTMRMTIRPRISLRAEMKMWRSSCEGN
jgi:hypothetical protein